MSFHKNLSRISLFFCLFVVVFSATFLRCDAMETPNYDNTVNTFFNKLTSENNICPTNSDFVIHKDHSVQNIDLYLNRICASHDELVARYKAILMTLKENFTKENIDNEWRGILSLLSKALEEIDGYTIPPKSGIYATSLYTDIFHERCVNHPIQFIRVLADNMSRKIGSKSLGFEWDPHRIYIGKYSETTLVGKRTLIKSSSHSDLMGFRGWIQVSFPYSDLITENLKDLKALTKLDLSKNLLRVIPKEIDRLITLKILNLSHNQLTELPFDFSNLTSLEELHLNDNQLNEFPILVRGLEDLKMLNLQNNKFKRVFDLIGHCTGLVSLNLSQMHELEIPESLGRLTNLTTLRLSVLHKFPSSIKSLQLLKKFDFIIKTPQFYPPKELVYLHSLQELIMTWHSPKDKIHKEFYEEPSMPHAGELATLRSCFDIFSLVDELVLLNSVISDCGHLTANVRDVIVKFYLTLSKHSFRKLIKPMPSSKAEYLSKYFNLPHFRKKRDLNTIHQRNAFYA